MENLLKTSSANFQNVFCNRDLWYKNIMFAFDIDETTHRADLTKPCHAIVMDFQLSRYLPPAVDVYQIIYMTTRRANRNEKCMLDYLKSYYSDLRENFEENELVEILSWEQFIESWNIAKYFAMIFNCTYAPLMYMPAHILEQLKVEDPEQYCTVSNEQRGDFIIQIMNENEQYKEIVLECVNELLEYLYSEDFKSL